jgi:hypothetical protein
VDFVIDIVRKFPDKYQMEVSFMAEKQQFCPDRGHGHRRHRARHHPLRNRIHEREEKLALSRNKNLFVVTHRLEPIVKVELRKHVINEPMQFKVPDTQAEVAPIEEITSPPVETPKGRGRKK